MDKTLSTVYVDEAGDLGASRGTQWFVLTAVIVDQAQEANIRATMKTIKSTLNLNTIHFRNVKDFNRRAYIVRELEKCNFTCVHVLFDTNQFDTSRIPSDRLAYNYICRYLIERVSWFMRDSNRIGKIILSSRGTSRDQDLINYIKDKLIPDSTNQISPVFTGVECKTAQSWDMLQLADVCATSMFYSHEINSYGMIVPCFAIKLWEKNYRHAGNLYSYGVKYFQNNMRPANGSLKDKRPCGEGIKNRGTPSATAT